MLHEGCEAILGFRAEHSGFTPGLHAAFASRWCWKSMGRREIFAPRLALIFQKKQREASMQLGIPKCLVCHLLSLLKPSLKGSLEDCEER